MEYNYIKNIPENVLFGIKREKNAIMITMQEVIPIDFIEHKIKILEKLKYSIKIITKHIYYYYYLIVYHLYYFVS